MMIIEMWVTISVIFLIFFSCSVSFVFLVKFIIKIRWIIYFFTFEIKNKNTHIGFSCAILANCILFFVLLQQLENDVFIFPKKIPFISTISIPWLKNKCHLHQLFNKHRYDNRNPHGYAETNTHFSIQWKLTSRFSNKLFKI